MFSEISGRIEKYLKRSILTISIIIGIAIKATLAFTLLPLVVVESFIVSYLLQLKPYFGKRLLWFIYFVDLYSCNIILYLFRWNKLSMHKSAMKCLNRMSSSNNHMTKLKMQF